jgi:hypothetical protein
MTKIAHYFCNFCNPSNQVRSEGDEVNTGYAAELADGFPLGWWEVPTIGPRGSTGHACPHCVLHNDKAKETIARERGRMTRQLLGEEVDGDEEGARPGDVPGDATTPDDGEARPAWPSIASPFGGSGDGGDGHDG